MNWNTMTLYSKARIYVQRAHEEEISSPLFGFWISLALELLCRASLSKIHPVLLADPSEPENIHYAFGIIPKKNPKSVAAKAVFARCSVMIDGFTDEMSSHCLIMADRRNKELHTGAAAFEGIDNSEWLPSTYEVMEILLNHQSKNFSDFLGEHSRTATQILKDRRKNLKKEVHDKISAARKNFKSLTEEKLEALSGSVPAKLENWLKTHHLHKIYDCPACKSKGLMTGEVLNRTAAKISAADNTIVREVRILPNRFICGYCKLDLKGFQETKEAGAGAVYSVREEENPIEFFGIIPEDHVDVEQLVAEYYDEGYANE